MFDRNIITKSSTVPLHSKASEGYLANQDVANNKQQDADNYLNALIKIIPAEIVSVYLALVPLVGTLNVKYEDNISVLLWWNWSLVLILMTATPFYLTKLWKIKDTSQVVMSCTALLIWIYCIGGPFKLYSWYEPILGTILAVLFSGIFFPIIKRNSK